MEITDETIKYYLKKNGKEIIKNLKDAIENPNKYEWTAFMT